MTTGRPDQGAPPHVLIVDDDRELCDLLVLRLESRGYKASAVPSVAAALAALGREHYDAMLLDLRLEDGDGFEVLEGVRKRSTDLPVVVLTAHGSIDTAVESMRRGAFGFVTKPFQDHDLLQKLAHAVESYRLRREVAGLRRIVGGEGETWRLVGVSTAIEQVRETIARVAPSDVTVLVLGESGTGKELVARSIHAASNRAQAPFVAVNCAALTPDLLESTLFGHVRGAFTGAVTDHTGLFGAAEGGTLFLDEVGEAPPPVQAKLLRALQERRYTRVGSTAEQEADVRVLAASNRDLRQEVAEKRFREDLFYRLHVVPLAVPPLRERREDVTLLAEMFLERSAARHNLPVPRLGPRALAALSQHAWPGNVRELANVIEAAALLCGGDEIGPEHLPGVGLAQATAPPAALDGFSEGVSRLLGPYAQAEAPPLPSLRDARDAFDRSYLDTVLTRTAGNVTLAAKLAGRNRTDFYDLLRRHGRSAADYKRGELARAARRPSATRAPSQQGARRPHVAARRAPPAAPPTHGRMAHLPRAAPPTRGRTARRLPPSGAPPAHGRTARRPTGTAANGCTKQPFRCLKHRFRCNAQRLPTGRRARPRTAPAGPCGIVFRRNGNPCGERAARATIGLACRERSVGLPSNFRSLPAPRAAPGGRVLCWRRPSRCCRRRPTHDLPRPRRRRQARARRRCRTRARRARTRAHPTRRRRRTRAHRARRTRRRRRTQARRRRRTRSWRPRS
jgi:two-component system, NtrC family, response regulator GlrR